jgi:hypothetical protein
VITATTIAKTLPMSPHPAKLRPEPGHGGKPSGPFRVINTQITRQQISTAKP